MKLSALSPWTTPRADLTTQAQVWHARTYARWLLSAGAEPRLGLLMSSGPLAESRWAQLLTEQGVQVERCRVTPERPLPAPLTQHRGDHFNRKLFLVEGLDELPEAQREDTLRTLNGQRNPLKQTATWVTLLTRHAHTVSALTRWAPHAYALIERRCLMWEVSERTGAHTQRAPLPAWATPLEHLFEALNHPEDPVDDLTFDRLVRAGVMRPPPNAHPSWRSREALWRGEVDFGGKRRRSSGAGVVEPLSDEVSPELAYLALTRRAEALSAAVRVQLEARLTPLNAWLLGTEGTEGTEGAQQALTQLSSHEREALSAWSALRATLERDAPPQPAQLAELERLWRVGMKSLTEPPSLNSDATLTACCALWLAEGYALLGDAEGLERVLSALRGEARLPLELRFIAGERLVGLYTLLQDRPQAQATLSALRADALTLGAPLYEAHASLAKAEHLGALDPERGAKERAEAERLAVTHGVAL